MSKYRALAIVLICMFIMVGCTPNYAVVSSSPDGGGEAQSTPSPSAGGEYGDLELIRATNLGIGEWRKDDPEVTYAEFFTMLDHVVELADPSRTDAKTII